MSTPAPVLSFGVRSFREGSTTVIERSSTGVDKLTGDYLSEAHDTYTENQVHPEYPGMIVRFVSSAEIGEDCWSHSLKCEGFLGEVTPTKIIKRGEEDSLEGKFDTASLTYLTWKGRVRSVTGVASTDVLTCIAHRWVDADQVVFQSLSGGAGLSKGVAYFVRDATANTFKLALTSGGTAINFTTDLTSGWLVSAAFAKGVATHPDHPFLFLASRKSSDDGTDWKSVDCTFKGLLGSKGTHRSITVNGQDVSRDSLYWGIEGGGWLTPTKGQAKMPQIVVTDTDVVTTAPDFSIVPTSDVTNEMAEPRTIPAAAVIDDPPNISEIYEDITGDGLTLHHPNHWSLISMECPDEVKGLIWLRRRTWQYIWRVTP